jgi:hypothetical protein
MSARASLVVAVVLAMPAFAQCSNLSGIAFTPYGAGCTGVYTTPVLTGSYSPATCTVSFTLTHSVSCCNTYLNRRVLVFGAAPAMNPLGVLPCNMLVTPDLIFEYLPTGSDTFTFPLPGGPLAGLTLYAQGGNIFFTTIGLSYSYEASNGLQILTF